MASPSDRQLEKHIRQSAQDLEHVFFTIHARQRMRQRYLNDPMVLEVLRQGVLATTPEPDIKHPGCPLAEPFWERAYANQIVDSHWLISKTIYDAT